MAIYLGVDLGNHSIVTASSSAAEERFQVTVDANGLSNRSTPSMIGIEKNRVIFGEEAENRLPSVPDRIISSITSAIAEGQSYRTESNISVGSSQLLSLFLKNYFSQVHSGKSIEFATIAVPESFSIEATKRVVDAAILAGIQKFDIIDHLDAAMTVLARDPLVAELSSLLVVDCGYSQTSVGMMVKGKCESKRSIARGVVDLVQLVSDSLVVKKLGFLSKIEKSDVKFHSKFFKICEKVLKDLSMLGSTEVDIGDFEDALERTNIFSIQEVKNLCKSPIIVSRDDFEKEFIQSRYMADLTGLFEPFKTLSPVQIEVVGGGSRVPVITKSISKLLAIDTLGRGLDGSSFAAVGAALWAAGKRGWEASRLVVPSETADYEEMKKIQSEIETRHFLQVEKLEKMNLLEAYLYQVKYWLNEEPRAKNLLNREILDPLLEESWNWFYAVEDGKIELSEDGSEFTKKLDEVKSIVESEGKAFFELLEKERLRIEQSLTANAENLQSSLSSHESAADKRAKHANAETSHNLSPDQALKLAAKNKDEGNDLFKHGTVTDAMNRYMRSINILAKISSNSFSQEDKKLADSILLASNLNMAQCVIRITAVPSTAPPGLSQDERDGLLKRGVACADAALAIDPANAKAKYRKAVCLDRLRETEQAKTVIDEALKESPNDVDLKQLYDSLVSTLKQQQTKAKKFFSRMFQ